MKLFSYTLTLVLFIFYGCAKENFPDDNSSPSVYKEIRDTAYGEHARHIMDIYLPENRSSETKILLLIHGGAWVEGDKIDMNRVINPIKKLDPSLAFVNINYRYANGNTVRIQDQIADVTKAIKFLSSNANKLNIGTKIAIVGASAGAHIAMMYAYKYDTSKQIKSVVNYFGPTRLDSEAWYNSFNLGLFKPNADVLYPLFGKGWDKDLYSQYSPYEVVTASNGKPTISLHGGLDPVVPKDHSIDLHNKLTQLNIPSQLEEYPNSLHVFWDNDFADSYPKVIKFVNKYW